MYEKLVLFSILVAVGILLGMSWGIIDRLDAIGMRALGGM